MSKTLSNGTLSLRFMQKAQRAKNQALVEAEQAKIKDDTEWEIPQEVRDAWGIVPSSSTRPGGVAYEPSYLPFMLARAEASGDAEASLQTETSFTSKVNGRRKFNSQGLEVAPVAPQKPEEELEPVPVQESASPKQRVKSISGFQAPIPIKSKDNSSQRTKTVQMLIREQPVKGPRDPPSSQVIPAVTTSATSPTGFLKPAGVEVPTAKPKGGGKRARDQPDAAGTSRKEDKKKRKVIQEIL